MHFKNDLKVLVLLDTEAKINIMIKKVMQNTRLTMKQGFHLKLVSYTGYSQPFLCLYKDVEIVVGNLKIKYLIFIIEYRDYNLVLK